MDKDKKVTKELMEEHFTGGSIVGETKPGQEDFPSKKLEIVAKSASDSKPKDEEY